MATRRCCGRLLLQQVSNDNHDAVLQRCRDRTTLQATGSVDEMSGRWQALQGRGGDKDGDEEDRAVVVGGPELRVWREYSRHAIH